MLQIPNQDVLPAPLRSPRLSSHAPAYRAVDELPIFLCARTLSLEAIDASISMSVSGRSARWRYGASTNRATRLAQPAGSSR
jgi:hypothetical protein